jgi:tRNA G18 (ribose-2'-O)-methylase SpoU
MGRMIVEIVSSADDPRLEPYRRVRDRDALGPDGRPGLFVGESPLVIEAMLRTPGVETISVLASERQRVRAEALIVSARGDGEGGSRPILLLAPDDVLNALVGFDIHRGFLAVGRRLPLRAVRDVVPPRDRPALLLLVEEINNIDNVGQLFRNAAAFGCDAVLLSPGCHDPLYRKSLRVSCGHALRVPFARSEDWHGDLAWLREEAKVEVLGMTGSGATSLHDAAGLVALLRPRRVAVLVGAEFTGLSPAALRSCSHRVRIPMAPGVDSLNVGVAAGVALSRLTER